MAKGVAAKHLDEKGRCCGRKPIVYKRPPHLFCHKCCASFSPETGEQIENWAFKKRPDGGFDSTVTGRHATQL